MKKLYEKSELTFAVTLIVVYSILQSVANPLNKITGIESSANVIFSLVLTVVLFCFIRKNNLLERYGFCKPAAPARSFLWYIPLLILATHNLWNGVAINFLLADMLCYICYMLCVGFISGGFFLRRQPASLYTYTFCH